MFNWQNPVPAAPMMPGAPLFPQSSVVIPQITIPQGLTAKPAAPIVKQYTAKGKDAAKAIPLGPNSEVAIFEEDLDLDVFYYRSTDEYGNDKDFRVCSYAEVVEPPPPKYLTEQEFHKTLEEFAKQLKEEFRNGQTVSSVPNGE